MRFKRAFLIGTFLLVLFNLASIVLTMQSVSAQTAAGCPGGPAGPPTQGTICERVGFVDKTTITLQRKTSGNKTVYLVDRDPYDSTYNYIAKDAAASLPLGFDIGAAEACADEVTISNFNGTPRADVIERNKNTSGHCDETKYSTGVDPQTLSVRNITGYRLDDDTLWLPIGFKDPGCDSEKASGINNKAEQFQRAPKKLSNGADNTAFIANQYDQTKDTGEATIYITTQGNGKATATDDLGNGNCQGASYTYDILLANNGSTTPPPESAYGKITATTPGGGGDGNGSTKDATADSCEAQSETLGWVMCPVIKLLDEAATWLDGQVQQLLITPNPSTLPNLEAAWARIRNITLILVIPIMLVMIISTALGFSFVDAYTIKRAMPRLLIAIIGISISFYLMSFLVTVTNSVGQGVLGLLTYPFFHGANPSLAQLVNAPTSASLTFAGLGIFLVLVSTGVVSFMIILSFAFVTVIALLIGFVVLTLRQLLILALIVAAPIAILLWIFPNTDRGWKLWWGNYSKLLLMFPLIMGMLAIGRDFAWIMAHSGAYSGVDNLLAQLMVIIAYIAPFFFIPAAFKMGGTMFGAMAGFATGAAANLRQGQTKYRGAQRAQNMEDFKAGKRFEGKSYIPGSRRLARGINSLSVGIGTGAKGGFGLGERGRQAVDQQRRLAMDAVTKTPEWNGINQNDDALHAATFDDAGAAYTALKEKWGDEERAKRAVRAVQTSVGFGRPQAIAAAQQLVTVGTGYKDMDDMVETLGRASGGNANTAAALAGFANSQTKGVGRHDLAPGFGDLNNLVQTSANTGRTSMSVGDSEWEKSMDKAKKEAWNSASLYAHANDKPQNMEAHIDYFTKMLNKGAETGNEDMLRDSGVFFEEIQAMQPNAVGKNAELINAALESTQGLRDQHVKGAPFEQLVKQRARTYKQVPESER